MKCTNKDTINKRIVKDIPEQKPVLKVIKTKPKQIFKVKKKRLKLKSFC